MTPTRARAFSQVTTQKIVSGEHLNPNGILFGGYLMCWMDEIAFMCARRFTGKTSCVTVNIDNITFRHPVRLNDQIHLSAWVNSVGKTSMEIEVSVHVENPATLERTHTNSAHLTFVCLDRKSRPTPIPALILETEEDWKKNHESQIRARVRKRLQRYLQGRISQNWQAPAKVEQVSPLINLKYFRQKLNQKLKLKNTKRWVREKLFGPENTPGPL